MFAASKSGRAVSAATTDPYFRNVPLLLETTSTNGQQNNTFLDSGTANGGVGFTITRNGTPTQGSVTPYWPDGYWSNYFNGSSYLTTPTSANLNLGTGSFTVEAWVNLSAITSDYFVISATGSGGAFFGFTNGGTSLGYGRNSIAWDYYFASGVTIGAWYHLAWCRSGTSMRMYVNGTQIGVTQTTSQAYDLSTTSTAIGSQGAIYYLNGFISNLRVINGVALYTGTTITVPSVPLTPVTSTALLTCQSNRFIDNNTQVAAKAISVGGGTPRTQAFQPFSPTASYTAAAYGGSGYFNGSTDYISAPSNAVFAFGTGDFTVECWIYLNAVPTTNPPILFAGNFYFNFRSSGTLAITDATVEYARSGVALTAGSWFHVAAVRSSAGMYVYVNGTRGTLNTGTPTFTQGIAYIGSDTTQYINGYISNHRVVKGVAVYTGNFTPPTLAPLTTAGSTSAASYSSTTNVNTSFASSATSLLTNYTNAGIYDAAVQNNEITVGSAQSSITQYKWSPTSMRFNGTTDYLTAIDGPQLQLSTGDFTIEGWVYLSATGVAYGIISKGTATTGWSVNVTSGNKLQFSYTASNLTGATSLSASTWYYFAVVRSGTATGNLKVYLNGTADATSGGAVTDSFTQTNTLYIGADRVGTNLLSGYLQDVRITKYARTITTPTAAFPTR